MMAPAFQWTPIDDGMRVAAECTELHLTLLFVGSHLDTSYLVTINRFFLDEGFHWRQKFLDFFN